ARVWVHFILPYMEQQAIYDAMMTYIQTNASTSMAWFNKSPNKDLTLTAFVCPSDPVTRPNYYNTSSTLCFMGNYAACAGSSYFNGNGLCTGINASPPGEPACPGANGTDPGSKLDGTFFTYSKVRVADITDGTSNTLAISENIVVNMNGGSQVDSRGCY